MENVTAEQASSNNISNEYLAKLKDDFLRAVYEIIDDLQACEILQKYTTIAELQKQKQLREDLLKELKNLQEEHKNETSSQQNGTN